MEKFVEFIKKCYESQYVVFINKLIAEKTPCGYFAPFIPTDQQINAVNEFRRIGINLTTILTTSENFPDAPADLKIVHLSNRENEQLPKYFFNVGTFPAAIMIPWFLDHGIEPVAIEETENTSWNAGFYFEHMPEIFEVYQDLDEVSQDVLLGYILGIISNRYSFCKYSENQQYILDGFIPKPGEVVIDAGVCDGSTSSMFADFGCRVIGFEMDSENYKIASKLAEKKNFVVENLGLGDENKSASYTHSEYNIGGSFIDDKGNSKTQLVTLDSYVQEHHLDSVDFIKMDTEGAELSILKGATNTITRFKPKLALSVYHKPEDIFTLYQFLKSIRPDYEFAFRHYVTTAEYAPAVFHDGMAKYCHTFDLPMRMCGFAKVVLFAR